MYRNVIFTMSLITFFVVIGCTTYVEQPTPPGQVAAPIHARPVKPYRNPHVQEVTPNQVPQQEAAPAPTVSQPLMSDTIAEDFNLVYRKAGSPRLAVFLNRSLSDEVREWRTTHRAVISVKGEMTWEDPEKSVPFKGPGGVAAYEQTHMGESRRSSPEEGWMWRFEEGFLGPFLDVGAKVVDRATIMRLTAAASGRQGSAYDPIAVKKIEMDSLTGKADLFLEVLIRRNPGTDLGYEFKASAKEVSTGIIRANVSTIGWNYGVEPTEKVIATASGYRFIEDKDSTQLPEASIVSRDLALALMRSLAQNWER